MKRTSWQKLLVGLLVAACGPETSQETGDAGETAGAASTGGAAGTVDAVTGGASSGAGTGSTGAGVTGEPGSEGGGSSSGTSGVEGSSSGEASEGSSGEPPPGDSGVCMVDPAQDLCSESCDALADCCQCGWHTKTPADVDGCDFPLGVVTGMCPWGVDSAYLDGAVLDQGCGVGESGWRQYQQDGDIRVELCGDTCTAYAQGMFEKLEVWVFCEAA